MSANLLVGIREPVKHEYRRRSLPNRREQGETSVARNGGEEEFLDYESIPLGVRNLSILWVLTALSDNHMVSA